MAEVKNSFLSSKMNKDLDDRLIPSNEYRDALNVAISNSEDGDVGALENVLQNTNVFKISSEPNSDMDYSDGKIIGYIVDTSKDNIYLFWTNYTDESANKLDNHQADPLHNTGNFNSAIIQYNAKNNSSTKVLIEGVFLNFSTTHRIYAANIVEDLLFWTDNRNQPRKINIKRANTPNYYKNEDDISVARYAPYKPIDLHFDLESTMKDVSSEFLPDGSINPDYNENYSGDKNFLEDKFVRFSYRYEYDDGEYSIIAPFTQIAFIPKQDGSFIDKYEDGVLLSSDEAKAYKSTVVSFMENKVDKISLVINLPDDGDVLESNYKIKKLDILYKESDKTSINVLDTILIDEISQQAIGNVYQYNYQSRKPIKTLPQSQSTRVNDKTPVRALCQEVSGNRVIYGNYVDKHTAPSHLNYLVTVTQKFTEGSNDNNWSYIEYPEHTVKRNRNYQVGFVLSDRYGRQSDVILSSVTVEDSSDLGFKGSSFYVPYKKSSTNPVSVLNDVGSSIKVQLNEKIESLRSPLDGSLGATGEPGLYDEKTNPTGWYSYKIVVKQSQQEYYNVYLPGFLNGFIDTTEEQNEISHTSLYSDNINKVPRSLVEVGPDQKLYRSDETLFPVVENTFLQHNNETTSSNAQFYTEDLKYEVSTIGDYDALNKLNDANNDSSNIIYNSKDNPLIARISTPKSLGVVYNNDVEPFLSIAETSPFLSNLDIYYETTTSGLISELNELVDVNEGTPVYSINNFEYNHKESQDPNGLGTVAGDNDSPFITSAFYPVNSLNEILANTEFVDFSVKDKQENNRTNDFELIQTSNIGITSYRLKITNSFYYGIDSNTLESYIFSMKFRNKDDNTEATVNGSTTSSQVFEVDNVTVDKPIYTGQTVYDGSTFIGTVVSVDETGLIVTLQELVTLNDGTILTFKAVVKKVSRKGSLFNVAPTVDFSYPDSYNLPSYSTMRGLYATIDAVNGAFDDQYKNLDLTYTWSTSQDLFTLGDFVLSDSGTNKLIVLNNPNGGYVTLSLNQSGEISVVDGFFDFSESFSLKAVVTDAGSKSVMVTVEFNDVIPGAFTDDFSDAFDI
jgi:hypothetical protein